jgi:hypothetical protein
MESDNAAAMSSSSIPLSEEATSKLMNPYAQRRNIVQLASSSHPERENNNIEVADVGGPPMHPYNHFTMTNNDCDDEMEEELFDDDDQEYPPGEAFEEEPFDDDDEPTAMQQVEVNITAAVAPSQTAIVEAPIADLPRARFREEEDEDVDEPSALESASIPQEPVSRGRKQEDLYSFERCVGNNFIFFTVAICPVIHADHDVRLTAFLVFLQFKIS